MFFMTGEENFYVSSSLVKEVASLGGDVHGLVPPAVVRAPRCTRSSNKERPCKLTSHGLSDRSNRRSRSPCPPRRPSSRPRASTSSASAPASPTSTRPRTSRTPRSRRSTPGAGKYTAVDGHGRAAEGGRQVARRGARRSRSSRTRSSSRRRQALAVQRVHGAARRRRRGHHPGAVLGQLPRDRDDGGRPAGDRARRAPTTTSRCALEDVAEAITPARGDPGTARRRTRPARSTTRRADAASPRLRSRRTSAHDRRHLSHARLRRREVLPAGELAPTLPSARSSSTACRRPTR